MKQWKKKILLILSFILLCASVFGSMAVNTKDIRKNEKVPEELQTLYAQSAVLMDADSGRVLYEKEGKKIRPMASTTKIMTCILALEQGKPDDIVKVSDHAVSQPKVHLRMRSKEQFYLKDLLYSLMLESHNDSAVAIAEHIGGTVEGFAKMMNEKAKEIGCKDTYFVTPNGLDSYDKGGTHSTTAEDLAKIMRYCIKQSDLREEFLQITQAENHSFMDVERKRNFSCYNHNAFLKMMDGALSGKTGFTGDAGYCYVGALKRGDKTFIVALLACGWPNNKGYKWSDTKKLMTYGIEGYEYRDVRKKIDLPPLEVKDGVPENEKPGNHSIVNIQIDREDAKIPVLLRKDESVQMRYDVKDELSAPVKKGEVVGKVTYFMDDNILRTYDIVTAGEIEKKNLTWCLRQIIHRILMNINIYQ